ncbi:MAG: thioredoxin-dependent thiol peroxidase [Myxococcota bacterium]
MLVVGDTVDEFTLCDQNGNEVPWNAFRGKPLVVFFYPRANTPGCTKEACAFRDLSSEFEAAGARVVGVSADSVKVQSNFTNKHDLNMPLLSDPDHVILEPWGVWGEKKMYGKTSMGIIRSTFLFDADGVVQHVWSPVRVKGHVDAVLEKVCETS